MVVLGAADHLIRNAGAMSYLELEATPSAATMRAIIDSWATNGVAPIGALAMWFDYAFMLAYATLFVVGARICLSANWQIPARLRPWVVALPAVAIVAALLDAVENALEMLVGYGLAPLPDLLAPIALAVTIVKWIGVALCFPAVIAALWAMAARRY